MKKVTNKAIAVGLSMIMMLSFAGCGSSSSKSGGVIDKDHIFKESSLADIGIDIGLGTIDQLCVKNGKVYALGSTEVENENGNSENEQKYLVIASLDGSGKKQFALPDIASEEAKKSGNLSGSEDGQSPEKEEKVEEVGNTDTSEKTEGEKEEVAEENTEGGQEASEDGEAVTESVEETLASTDEISLGDVDDSYNENYSFNYFYYDELAVDTHNVIYVSYNYYSENYEDGDYQYTETNGLVKLDEEGNILGKYSLEDQSEEGSRYNAFIVGNDGNIYCTKYDNAVYVFDNEMNPLNRLECSDIASIEGIYLSGDSVIISGYDSNYTDFYYAKIANNGNSIEQAVKFPVNANGYTAKSSDGSADIYLVSNMGLSKWNFNDKEVTTVFNFIDSEINATFLQEVAVLSSTEMIVGYNDISDYQKVFSYVTKVDPKEVKDKQVLTMAAYYLDYGVRSKVCAFNKSHDDIKIQVTDYSMYDGTGEDNYNAGMDKMNMDLMSGNCPDIFILNRENNIENLMDKGLFTDLNPLIEKDANLNKEDFAQNVMDAYSIDGKWYVMIPGFEINTLVAKKSLVGDKNSWTFDEMKSILSTMSEEAIFTEDCTRESVLTGMLEICGNQFVDWQTGKCQFEDDLFVQLLEFANQYPETREHDDEFWENYDSYYRTMYRENKVLAKPVYIGDIKSLKSILREEFGETVSFVGYPSRDGQGSCISFDSGFAISQSCAAKESAWEFISQFLNEEYQESDEFYYLPLSMKAMEKKKELATQKDFYLDENGNKVEMDDYYYVDGNEVVMEPLTQDEVNQFVDFAYTVTNRGGFSYKIINIITEEANAYFNNQKSAKDVAKIIQGRVQLYVNENR